MNNNNPYILVLGASIVDIIGFSKREFKAKDSNPGAIKISLGGVCRNIAENLARVGVNTEFYFQHQEMNSEWKKYIRTF